MATAAYAPGTRRSGRSEPPGIGGDSRRRRRDGSCLPPRSLPAHPPSPPTADHPPPTPAPTPTAHTPPTHHVRALALDVEFDHWALPRPPSSKPVGKAARRAAAARNKRGAETATATAPVVLRVPAALALVEAGGASGPTVLLWAGIDPPAELVATPGAARLGRTAGRSRHGDSGGGRPPPPLQLPSAAAAATAVLAALAGPPPATVLIGHGLGGDLAALGLGDRRGAPLPPALATVDTLSLTGGSPLAAAAARLDPPLVIQAGGPGTHCPVEDTGAALAVWLAVGEGEAVEAARVVAEAARRRALVGEAEEPVERA
jgi:hypothetical protein